MPAAHAGPEGSVEAIGGGGTEAGTGAGARQPKDKRPLIYADMLATKADAAAGVQTLLARVRDDHGTMPEEVVFRLHSDKGTGVPE